MDIVNNFISNHKDMTGNIAKAVLMIRRCAPQIRSTVKVDNSKNTADLLGTLMKAADSSVIGNPSFGSSSINTLGKTAAAKGFFPLEVQYNPDSITYNATMSGSMRAAIADGSTAQRTTERQILTLSAKLVFDAVNNNDAFSFASETLVSGNIGNAISLGSDVIKKAMGQQYSIQTIMEGIVSLLADINTQEVIFYWGKTCFHGNLTAAACNYKMFNKKGNPILGELDITIQQNRTISTNSNNSNESNEKALMEADKKYWEARFKNAFEQKNAVSGFMEKIDSKRGIF